MALDYWADHYARRPNDDTIDEAESNTFEADVEAMFVDDESWEDV